MFSREFHEICKNTNFVEHLEKAASGIFLQKHNEKIIYNYKI